MSIDNKDLLQAITDAFTGLTIAIAGQLDKQRLAIDLRGLAQTAEERGQPVSAGLLLEMADAAEARA